MSCYLKLNNSNFRFQICYIMTNDLTVKKILDKLARNQRLTHNEELTVFGRNTLFFRRKSRTDAVARGTQSQEGKNAFPEARNSCVIT